jgi:hypothetical protein
VIAWAQANVPDFITSYNKPMSSDIYSINYQPVITTTTTINNGDLSVKILNAKDGDI